MGQNIFAKVTFLDIILATLYTSTSNADQLHGKELEKVLQVFSYFNVKHPLIIGNPTFSMFNLLKALSLKADKTIFIKEETMMMIQSQKRFEEIICLFEFIVFLKYVFSDVFVHEFCIVFGDTLSLLAGLDKLLLSKLVDLLLMF